MTKPALGNVSIRHTAIGGRIVLARFGKDPSVALETRDAMNDFWQTLVSYAFDGKMPDKGAAADVDFGGGDEQFSFRITRLPTTAPLAVDQAMRVAVVKECAQIAQAFADSEELNAVAGAAASTGVKSPGWLKDALHSNGQEVAEKIAAAILAALKQEGSK